MGLVWLPPSRLAMAIVLAMSVASIVSAQSVERQGVHNGTFELGLSRDWSRPDHWYVGFLGVDPWFQDAFRSIGIRRLDGTPKRSHALLERITADGRRRSGGRRVTPAGTGTPGS